MTLLNNASYRIQTESGRTWDRVTFDASELVFRCSGRRRMNGTYPAVSLAHVTHIAAGGRFVPVEGCSVGEGC